MIKNLLLVGLGGGAGSVLRYLCQKWINEYYPATFPWATLVVNILGCLLIGIIYAISEKTSLLSPQIRLMLTAGLCGGFTTFSTFAFENLTLLKSGDVSYLLIYTLASCIIGVAAVFGGISLVKLL